MKIQSIAKAFALTGVAATLIACGKSEAPTASTAASAPAAAASSGRDLQAIKNRGELICGVNQGLPGFSSADSQGRWSGLDVDLCRAVAATVLNDASKVRYVPLTSQQRFTALQSGEIDMLARNSTWTLTRDASLGLHFAGVNFYDGQGFMVPKSLNVTQLSQLRGATVCVEAGTTTELNLADFSRANNLNLRPVVFAEVAATTAAYFGGRCQAYTTDLSALASYRANEAPNPADHVILSQLISKEPLGPVVRRGDDEFFAIVKWTHNVMLEAEELGITQANVDELRTSSTNPNIRRILGAGEENSGRLLGLDKDWAYRIIKQVGNYGEVFERNVGKGSNVNLDRGVNALWTEGGLQYAPPVR